MITEDQLADKLISLNAAYDRSHPQQPPQPQAPHVRRLSVLERENRELRGEVMALRHVIQKMVDECMSILQTG